MKNNTRKHRGGIGINIFGKTDYGKSDYGKPRIFKEPRTTELPFMYFYNISDSKKEEKSIREEEQKSSKEEEQKSTREEEQKYPITSDKYDIIRTNILMSKDTTDEKRQKYINLKNDIEKDINISDERRKYLIQDIDAFILRYTNFEDFKY